MKHKTLLVTGGSGFIGSHFLPYIADWAMPIRVLSPSRQELNILNLKQATSFFDEYRPDFVVHFAAHRDANSAEQQRNDLEGSAWQTNVIGTKNVNDLSRKYQSFFIHISTDMVFSGDIKNKGPYPEDKSIARTADHVSWYGWTKAQAERIVSKNPHAATIRIGNVTHTRYDPKTDYVGKILYLFDHKKLYPLFSDQYLTLSYIPAIFEAIKNIVVKKMAGIYHIASTNIFTPHELGTYLIQKARGKSHVIEKARISSIFQTSPLRYPRYGGLLSARTNSFLGIRPRTWQEIVDEYINTYPLFLKK